MNWALSRSSAPWAALAVTKLIAGFIGLYCYRSRRITLLRRANAGYSVVVGWNLIAIFAGLLAYR